VTVAVLTDTTSALPDREAAEWGIHLVPLTVTVDGRTYRDGEIAPEHLVGADQPTALHTAGPSPGEFVRQLESAMAPSSATAGGADIGAAGAEGGADGAVIITVAEALSSTYACARLAAGSSALPVEIVDSGTAAGGQALVALAAAQQARAGAGLAEVAKAARDAAAKVRLVGCMRSLDRLVASGRVPEIAGVATRRLGVWPMFELSAGRIRPLRPARSAVSAIDRIADMCGRGATERSRSGGEDVVADVIVLDSGLPDAAVKLLARVRERARTGYELSTPFGSAMTVHTGTGVLGLAWLWRPRTAAGPAPPTS